MRCTLDSAIAAGLPEKPGRTVTLNSLPSLNSVLSLIGAGNSSFCFLNLLLGFIDGFGLSIGLFQNSADVIVEEWVLWGRRAAATGSLVSAPDVSTPLSNSEFASSKTGPDSPSSISSPSLSGCICSCDGLRSFFLPGLHSRQHSRR
jgi:hypothetical protein